MINTKTSTDNFALNVNKQWIKLKKSVSFKYNFPGEGGDGEGKGEEGGDGEEGCGG